MFVLTFSNLCPKCKSLEEVDSNINWCESVCTIIISCFMIFLVSKVDILNLLEIFSNITLPRIPRAALSLEERMFPAHSGVTAVYSVSDHTHMYT